MIKEMVGREVWIIQYYDSMGSMMCDSFESAYRILKDIIETDNALGCHAVNEYLGILERRYEEGLKRDKNFLYEYSVGKIATVRELPVYNWIEEE